MTTFKGSGYGVLLVLMVGCGADDAAEPSAAGIADRASVAHAESTNTDTRETQAVDAVLAEAKVTPVLKAGLLEAASEQLATKVPIDGRGWVELERPGEAPEHRLRVSLPIAAMGAPAVVAGDGAITYRSAVPATDLAIRTFERSVQFETIIRGPAAPVELNYAIDLPAAGKLLPGEDGSLVIMKDNETGLGGMAAPSARDANGVVVPTRLEIRDSMVTVVVEHRSQAFSYPIVVAQQVGREFVVTAWWKRLALGWQLKVIPTAWAKQNASYSASEAGWRELYSKYKDRGLNTNLDSMRHQWICHQMLNVRGWFGGPTWDLEEYRPDVGLFRFMLGRCNPGDRGSSSY